MISREEPIIGASPEHRDSEHDFSTHNLVEWWTTTNTHTEEGFHSTRGTPYPEIDLMHGESDLGGRLTALPQGGGSHWDWQHDVEEAAALWSEIQPKLTNADELALQIPLDIRPNKRHS